LTDTLYSKNQLTNPGAETGDLTGWTTEGIVGNVGVTSGGPSTGTYCFFIKNSSTKMYQNKSYFTTPSDFVVEVDFLPSTDQDSGNFEIEGIVKLTLNYGDYTKDELVVPLRDDSGGA